MNRPLLKILNVAGFALFAVFAYFQHNDIDPAIYYHPSMLDAWLWLAFYALVAFLFLGLVMGKRPPRWLLVVAALWCLVEMVRTGPGVYANLFKSEEFTMTGEKMSAARPEVELTREFFGSLIALAGVGFLAWQRRAVDSSAG